MINTTTLNVVLNRMALSSGQKSDIRRRLQGFDFSNMYVLVVPDHIDLGACMPEKLKGAYTVADIIQYHTSDEKNDDDLVRVVILEGYSDVFEQETADLPLKVVFEIKEDGQEMTPITLLSGEFKDDLISGIRRRVQDLQEQHRQILDLATGIMDDVIKTQQVLM